MSNHKYDEFILDWKNGKKNGIRGSTSTSNHIRKYILNKYNNKCARCGWCEINKFTNKIPLEVEHIDGDFSNNREDNLILLCPNCHSLTATWKGANKKNCKKRERGKYYKNNG